MKSSFLPWVLGLVVVAALLQAAILQQGWSANPFAAAPIADAQVNWNEAGRIAGGELVGATPFLSAPLYLYVLGVLRALGVGLLGAYVVQAVAHLATVVLIADAGRRRFDATTGLVAAALYVILLEPAYTTGRILNGSVQLLTVAWVLWQAAYLADRRTRARVAGLGVALGFSALANPAMLIAVAVFAVWVAMRSGERDVAGGVLVVLSAALVIAPATWHNRQASGETILISAQAGVTFAHGNAPGARGVYHPIPGVSANRLQQNLDAYRLAAEATGKEGWSSTNRYFFRQGLAYLAGNPGQALKLEMRKLWWLLSGRVYGDLYTPWFEEREAFGSRLRWTPLALATLLPLAVLGFVLAATGEWRKRVPELVLFAVPVLVVVVFWYSPRYRLPVAPVAVVLAAWALVRAGRAFAGRPRRVVLAVAACALLLTGPVIAWVNRASGFENPDELRPGFFHSVGDALRMQGKAAEALPYMESAVHEGFDTAASRYGLFQVRAMRAEELWAAPDPQSRTEAVRLYVAATDDLRASLRHEPDQLEVHENLATLEFWLWRQGLRPAAAVGSEISAALALAEREGNEALATRLRDMLRVLRNTPPVRG